MKVDVKTIKKGIYTKNSYTWREKTLYCGCGKTETFNGSMSTYECSCGNRDFKYSTSKPIRSASLGSIVEVVEKNDRFVHLNKVSLRAKFESNAITEIVKGKSFELKADLRKRTIELFKNGEKIDTSEDNLEEFSKNIENAYSVIESFSTESNKELFESAYSLFGTRNLEKYGRIHRIFTMIFSHPFIDTLYYCGFKADKIWNNRYQLDYNETKPHKIIGVPKYMVSILKNLDSLSYHDIGRLQDLEKSLTPNNLKEVVKIFQEESNLRNLLNYKDEFLDLYNDYGYKNSRKLALYLTRETKLAQGIGNATTACSLLRDYVRMCKEMNAEFEKYPKSLKKEHDIATMNYNATRNQRDNENFAKVVEEEEYKNLEMNDKKFSIVAPKNSEDIVNEGKMLSHCVASYVSEVRNKKCKILFLRSTDNIEKSLVTIEVRNNSIKQARRYENKKPTIEEMDFILDWAKEKDLRMELYY